MTDEERAKFLETLATSRDVRLDDIATLEEIASRLRARSEDADRLIAVLDRLEVAALSLACGNPVRDLDEICSEARHAVYSARKRGE